MWPIWARLIWPQGNNFNSSPVENAPSKPTFPNHRRMSSKLTVDDFRLLTKFSETIVESRFLVWCGKACDANYVKKNAVRRCQLTRSERADMEAWADEQAKLVLNSRHDRKTSPSTLIWNHQNINRVFTQSFNPGAKWNDNSIFFTIGIDL